MLGMETNRVRLHYRTTSKVQDLGLEAGLIGTLGYPSIGVQLPPVNIRTRAEAGLAGQVVAPIGISMGGTWYQSSELGCSSHSRVQKSNGMRDRLDSLLHMLASTGTRFGGGPGVVIRGCSD